MVPPLAFYTSITITGNDCGCCRPRDLKPGDRVIYTGGRFATAGNTFLAGSIKRREEEDQRVRDQYRKMRDEVVRQHGLRPENAPALIEGKCVEVRDVLELKAWIQGVQACQIVPRLSSSMGGSDTSPLGNMGAPAFPDPKGAPAFPDPKGATAFPDPMDRSNRSSPPTPLKIVAKKADKKPDPRARVVWDERRQMFVAGEEDFMGRFREDSQRMNRATREKLRTEVSAVASGMGVDPSRLPLPTDEKQEKPLTYQQMMVINAWIKGLGAVHGRSSSEDVAATPVRDESRSKEPFS